MANSAKAKKDDYGAINVDWAIISIRTIKIGVIAVLAIAAGLIYWFVVRPAMKDGGPKTPTAAVPSSAARFMDYSGRVEVKPRDEFVWREASFKTELHDGDRVRTSADSSAKIKFDDGTEITVQPDSIIEIKRKQDSANDQLAVIEEGTSDINAEESKFAPTVKTPNIKGFQLTPGSKGIASTDKIGGNDTTTISEGTGNVTTQKGEKVSLNDLEQLKIDKENKVVKEKLPLIPGLISPQNGQIFPFIGDSGLTVELKWRDVADAASYHVQISENSLFAKLSAEKTKLVKSSLPLGIPKTRTNKKQYYWRVRSIDKDGKKSPWSEPFQFVAVTQGAKPQNDATGQIDKTPPALKITYMHPFYPYIQVEGRTEPDVFLTLNTQIIDVKQDGSFVFTYTLTKAGTNILKFVAEDPAGNKSTVEKKVEY